MIKKLFIITYTIITIFLLVSCDFVRNNNYEPDGFSDYLEKTKENYTYIDDIKIYQKVDLYINFDVYIKESQNYEIMENFFIQEIYPFINTEDMMKEIKHHAGGDDPLEYWFHPIRVRFHVVGQETAFDEEIFHVESSYYNTDLHPKTVNNLIYYKKWVHNSISIKDFSDDSKIVYEFD